MVLEIGCCTRSRLGSTYQLLPHDNLLWQTTQQNPLRVMFFMVEPTCPRLVSIYNGTELIRRKRCREVQVQRYVEPLFSLPNTSSSPPEDQDRTAFATPVTSHLPQSRNQKPEIIGARNVVFINLLFQKQASTSAITIFATSSYNKMLFSFH